MPIGTAGARRPCPPRPRSLCWNPEHRAPNELRQQRISHLMRRHYRTIMAAKVGIQAIGHGVRPISSGPTLGVRGDRIGATARRRAP